MDSTETALTANETGVVGIPSIQRNAKPGDVEVLIPALDNGGIVPIPLTKTLQGIGQIRNEAAMMLLCSHASRLEADLGEAKKAKDEVQKKSEEWMQRYYDEKERSAVLGIALKKDSSKKNIQRIVGVFGALITGQGVTSLIKEPTGLGLAATIIGVALLVVSFWPSENEK